MIEDKRVRFKTSFDWLNKALPEGLPVPSSTVLIGPLEAGKPIIAQAFVSSWLKEGGGVVSAPLQFPDSRLFSEDLKQFYNLDIEDYEDKFIHVRLDVSIDSIEVINKNKIKANLVKPDNWDRVIEIANKVIRPGKPGLMFFISALNLPLFSKTYSDSLMNKFRQLLSDNKFITYMICISTSMLKEKAEKIGEMADNEMEAYFSRQPKKLIFEIKRMKDTKFLKGELEAPFSSEMLRKASERAKEFRFAPVKELKEI